MKVRTDGLRRKHVDSLHRRGLSRKLANRLNPTEVIDVELRRQPQRSVGTFEVHLCR
jgi:hypothetical protein